MRHLPIAGALVLAGALLVLAPATASRADEKPSPDGTTAEAPPAKRQPHTLYDDHGALDWRPKLEDALALAKARRKLVFIEWGRET
jgi:hypothetical protein